MQLTIFACLFANTAALCIRPHTSVVLRSVSASMLAPSCPDPLDPSLQGDPSLVLNVNVKLKDKHGFMTKASSAIAECLSKPEIYVAVCVHDEASLIFAGTPAPAALGCVYSIGSINQANNGALTARISALLKDHGEVEDTRIYLNFFDVERANCGWSSRTFAG